MNTKTLSVWLSPILLCIASVSANAYSEPGELINHPYFTLNGCPLDREWTDEVVNAALGLKPRMLERMKNRFGVEKERLCSGSWDDLEGFVRQANSPKHRTDEPDGARAFRRCSSVTNPAPLSPTGSCKRSPSARPCYLRLEKGRTSRRMRLESPAIHGLGSDREISVDAFAPFRRIRRRPMTS